jgi:redox-sensitive bicupin YhaK (pirin superfamily)
VYVLEGSAIFGGHAGVAHHPLVLSNTGSEDGLKVTTEPGQACRFALLAGQPLKEPIVQHGPFVMNTREEIMQAMRDFQSGKNGFEGAAQWASEGGKSFH